MNSKSKLKSKIKHRVRRLKIAEQVIIVVLIAVLVPLGISTAIITNINQQAVRKEIKTATLLSANSVQRYISNKLESTINLGKNIAALSDHSYSNNQITQFLKKIENKDPEISSIRIVQKRPSFTNGDKAYAIDYDNINKKIIVMHKTGEFKYVQIELKADILEQNLLKDFEDIERSIYLLDDNNQIIAAKEKDKAYLDILLKCLPNGTSGNDSIVFFLNKNQPNALIKINNSNWKAIITTPKELTLYGITSARYKIISIILLTAIAIIFLCSMYSLSLYTNIRQLFKAMNAVSDGNYNRKIRLITNYMTPYEIIYLSKAFNKMVQQIKESYKELTRTNKKLKELDSFKSNLIDTVSHEFRTPLTSIKGYSSRLLRSDVNIDENVKQDSLKIIKRQAERLSRMVDDLLVIPDIETSAIKFFIEPLNLKNIIDNVILSISHNKNQTIKRNIPENLGYISGDADRVEQILINLLGNASKYSGDDSVIEINATQKEHVVEISVINECETIEQSKLNKLFDKFTRMEDSTTRTTRGTGLGLFIVKGLVEAMQGEISLSSDSNFKVTLTLPLAK